jgi:DNA modification methylase
VKANRNFIGCELDKQYYDIAQKRIKLEQDKKETELFKE